MYNLDDDEELTHYGQSLGDMKNFDDADLQLTDDERDEGAKIINSDSDVFCNLVC